MFFSLGLFLLTAPNIPSVHAEETAKAVEATYLIQKVKADQQGEALTIEIVGNSSPQYTTFELYNPTRLNIDIAHAKIEAGVDLAKVLTESKLAKITAKPVDKDPGTTRFEISIADSHIHSVEKDKNNLLILIHPKADVAKTGSEPAVAKKTAAPADATLDKLIDSSATAINKGNEKGSGKEPNQKKTGSSASSFDFGGYKDAKSISVDFYKIDLHNVFRLFREVSGVNIIVDEAVQGSLTLALNDVPWDFALDIILNLKDLRKEEKFNTIVIYPAKKEFVWPERAQDNLSVEADLEIIQQVESSLVIEQGAVQSEEIIQSKEFIRKGRIEEQAENMEKAAAFYEQALKLDPKNAKVATRLASLNLTNLNNNAKAVYFAKETLKIEPKNTQAALYAAIALANMNQAADASSYFSQSISGATPMKEALVSYAAFSEQNGQPDAALKLIARATASYGESVDTLVAKGRIYDAMGQKDKANEQYKALLSSGYPLAPGLKEFVQSRVGAPVPSLN
jgi:type IV pilus assembly protein PilQ